MASDTASENISLYKHLGIEMRAGCPVHSLTSDLETQDVPDLQLLPWPLTFLAKTKLREMPPELSTASALPSPLLPELHCFYLGILGY